MLLEILMSVAIGFIQMALFWLPEITSINVDILAFEFPIDDYLVTGMGYFAYLLNLVPPLETIYHGFLFILYWKSTLLIVRVLPFVGRFVR